MIDNNYINFHEQIFVNKFSQLNYKISGHAANLRGCAVRTPPEIHRCLNVATSNTVPNAKRWCCCELTRGVRHKKADIFPKSYMVKMKSPANVFMKL